MSFERELDVSVILPTYNEEGNASRLVSDIYDELKAIEVSFEIIVVDDDSQDGTVFEVERDHEMHPEVKTLVRKGETRGLAFSIKDGVLSSKGSSCVFMDSDYNHHPKIVPQMVKMIQHYDMVCGSRFSPGGGMENRFRYWCSYMFNMWMRMLLFLPIRDNLSGFICIRRDLLDGLNVDQIFKNYGDYYVRLLYEAYGKKYSMLELPVWYMDRQVGESKTRFFNILFLYSKEAIKLRLRTLFR